jgi:hypothetical protein
VARRQAALPLQVAGRRTACGAHYFSLYGWNVR